MKNGGKVTLEVEFIKKLNCFEKGVSDKRWWMVSWENIGRRRANGDEKSQD